MNIGYDLLLPRGMTDYFDAVSFEEIGKTIILHLKEKSLSPSGVSSRNFISKGFYPAVDIHDFPVRDSGGCILCVYVVPLIGRQTGAPCMRDWAINS
ncbi:MAG: hypothetical protein LBH58_11745 [Tannerellaceae bacterium]|jgi:hypothetical protein|nr:hypothetical protein [Tannerellaceae bacterium]